jgi:hypothetical protein
VKGMSGDGDKQEEGRGKNRILKGEDDQSKLLHIHSKTVQ